VNQSEDVILNDLTPAPWLGCPRIWGGELERMSGFDFSWISWEMIAGVVTGVVSWGFFITRWAIKAGRARELLLSHVNPSLSCRILRDFIEDEPNALVWAMVLWLAMFGVVEFWFMS
tara:strand:- start:3 stop:353 length:351 start_codon:yes stop_codon:yes gene_type:complete